MDKVLAKLKKMSETNKAVGEMAEHMEDMRKSSREGDELHAALRSAHDRARRNSADRRRLSRETLLIPETLAAASVARRVSIDLSGLRCDSDQDGRESPSTS